MNISFIIPIYNEPTAIYKTVECIKNLQHDGEKEILIVDDGSDSETKNALSELEIDSQVKVLTLDSNRGRAYARYAGATHAEHQSVLFVDSRIILRSDFLESFLVDENIIMPGNVYPQEDSAFFRVVHRLRQLIFFSYYQKLSHQQDIVMITEENYDSIPKGTTCVFFRNREVFLKACKSFDLEKKGGSDDTKLLRSVVESGNPIARNMRSAIYYGQRKGLLSNILHFYRRGPTFVDYYFRHSMLIKTLLLLSLTLILILFILLLLSPGLFMKILPGLLFLNALLSVIICRGFQGALETFLFLPILIFSFLAGTVQGIFLFYRKS